MRSRNVDRRVSISSWQEAFAFPFRLVATFVEPSRAWATGAGWGGFPVRNESSLRGGSGIAPAKVVTFDVCNMEL